MIKRLLGVLAVSAPLLLSAASAAENMDDVWPFCNLALKDPPQAISACTKIIERGAAKDRLIAFNQRGRAFLVRGWTDNALADFNEVLKLEPKFADGYNNRAVAYRLLGRFQESLADHDRAIAMEKRPIFIQARENTLKKMAKEQ
jgi:tetratricopeptide (TPR) repeat protein